MKMENIDKSPFAMGFPLVQVARIDLGDVWLVQVALMDGRRSASCRRNITEKKFCTEATVKCA